MPTVKNIMVKSVMLVAMVWMVCTSGVCRAQYNNWTTSGTMSSTTNYQTDTSYYETDTTYYKNRFTVKRYFNALAHKDTMNVSNMFFGAMILPGTGQIYNKQSWKLPIVYGALGGCIGGAVVSNMKWKKDGSENAKDLRDAFVIGAIGAYWGQLLDATASYKSYEPHLPARASLYSALLPGLGQAYNGDYWHIPLYYAGFAISGYCWGFNQKQYKRYKKMYQDAYKGEYTGNLTQENILWYRDQYRRNRDYSVVATLMIYVLNIIDANVFAHFKDFDVSDDISFNVRPTLVQPEIVGKGCFTLNNASLQSTKPGVQMCITF